MPLTEICNATYSDPRERQLFKNIIYLGALAALMDLEPGVIAELIGEQYKGKEKLLKPNLNALQLGLNYSREHLKDQLGLKAKRAYAVGDQMPAKGSGKIKSIHFKYIDFENNGHTERLVLVGATPPATPVAVAG